MGAMLEVLFSPQALAAQAQEAQLGKMALLFPALHYSRKQRSRR
jgi:hypothetical protein